MRRCRTNLAVTLLVATMIPGLGSLAGAADLPNTDPYPEVGYDQPYRPQFHFTSRKNWLNDPNGLVYLDGEYHLFFQHNPKGTEWGSMTWGHAVSNDLLHWKQIQHAILPHDGGDIWSGSAAVDWKNASGFGRDGKPPLVAAYTHATQPKFTQHLAFSTDRGRIWTPYRGNPVVPNQVTNGERDPRIFWHAPTKRWVMVISANTGLARIFHSTDLKQWVMACDVARGGFEECPDLFELPVLDVEGKPTGVTRWVLHDGSFTYSVGTFDGKTYKIEETPGKGDLGQNFYAGQTFNDVPDGRRIQIGWMRGGGFAEKGMPFNQQMSFPCELTLRRTDEGIRLYRRPVKEVEKLRAKSNIIKNLKVAAGVDPLRDIHAELIDLQVKIAMGSAKKITFNLRGSIISYDGRTLSAGGSNVPLKLRDGAANLHILIDRASIEVFGNDGRISITSQVLRDPANKDLSLLVEGGEATINTLAVHELTSCWK